MTTPRQRRRTKNPNKTVRRRPKPLLAKRPPTDAVPAPLRGAWDAKRTVWENYAAMGLVAALDGRKGGVKRGGWRVERVAVPEGETVGVGVKVPKDEEGAIEAWLNRPADEVQDTGDDGEGEGGEGPELGPQQAAADPEDDLPLPADFAAKSGLAIGQPLGHVPKRAGKRQRPAVEEAARAAELVRGLEEMAANARKHRRHMSAREFAGVKELIEKHGDNYEAMARDRKLNPEQHTPAQLRRKCEKYRAHADELARLEEAGAEAGAGEGA
ncbi:ribosome biogenesis protein Nop16 [Hyaloraphidium curvatum]|nr:ribosome biogenesis protein Nop16 [Hyaloraphidium curvatum]